MIDGMVFIEDLKCQLIIIGVQLIIKKIEL